MGRGGVRVGGDRNGTRSTGGLWRGPVLEKVVAAEGSAAGVVGVPPVRNQSIDPERRGAGSGLQRGRADSLDRWCSGAHRKGAVNLVGRGAWTPIGKRSMTE